MKFKHGDKVTCKIQGVEITDARISIDNDGTPFICQNIKEGINSDDKLGYKYSWRLNEDFTDARVTDLKKVEKNISDISTYEVGDILVDKDGYERMVLAVCGKLVFMSGQNEFLISGFYYTVEEIERWGFTFKQEEEIKEMTVSQVSELVGQKVKIIEG